MRTRRTGPCPYTAAVQPSLAMPRVTRGTVGAVAALFYVVLVGGTAIGELDPWLRLANAGVAAGFLAWYVVHAPRHADRIDRAVVMAVIVFASAALLSRFPRQSLDALLAAMTYAAALFVARGLLATAGARAVLERSLMTLALVLTLLTAGVWLPLVYEWWSLTGWRITPPLDLALPSGAWGHRHDLALLAAMLYPSWWIGRRPGPLRAAAAIVLGVLVLLIVIVDGSRTLWLAIAVATGVLAAPPLWRRLRRSGAARAVLPAAVLAAVSLLWVTGVVAALIERIGNIDTLSSRTALWTHSVEAWLTSPLGGLGPGSYPWALQQTDYFDARAWAPRHPDSMPFQLLAEGGALGIAAVLCLALFLVPAVLRCGTPAARWALVTFAVASIGANPTDFAFLVAVAIAWTAYALPRATAEAVADGRRPMTRALSLAAMGVIGLAHLATVGAGLLYAQASTAAQRGDLAAVEQHLSGALMLDPGMALYWRQRGTERLLDGRSDAAVNDLEEATLRNPSDDLAWRTLGLALRETNQPELADAALKKAIRSQRADPTNLLLRAQWALDDGRDELALDTLAAVVQAWPMTVAAPAWNDLIAAADFRTEDVVRAAVQRWSGKLEAPEGDPILLAVLADRQDLISLLGRREGAATAVTRATIASYHCDPRVREILATASDGDRRYYRYWELLIRDASARGVQDPSAERLLKLMTDFGADRMEAEATLNPLDQNDVSGFSADVWGYRRRVITWPNYGPLLPSPMAGTMRWRVDPIGASRASSIAPLFQGCR